MRTAAEVRWVENKAARLAVWYAAALASVYLQNPLKGSDCPPVAAVATPAVRRLLANMSGDPTLTAIYPGTCEWFKQVWKAEVQKS